ncbi:hypothetical protein [Streptomyces sp. NPDC058335]|uniref:hypothetical protein n=1 Tax=Streptomyces sp. NPDC058335 TaxID=3346451 RepID=UPI0036543AC3
MIADAMAGGDDLHIADSLKGVLWSVTVSGGSATEWLTDPALASVPTEALPIGANVLRFTADINFPALLAGASRTDHSLVLLHPAA